jgi:CheY-like chemotaxis protein
MISMSQWLGSMSNPLETNMLLDAPVLVAEDDANDVFLLRRAFQKAGVAHPVVVLRNGQEVVDYLTGSGMFANRKDQGTPALLFLDLKMPMMDGFDVLDWLQNCALKRKPPVVVLTSSNQEKDIQRARQMGAHEYRVKPQQFEELVEIVKEVNGRWLNGRCDRSGNPGG